MARYDKILQDFGLTSNDGQTVAGVGFKSPAFPEQPQVPGTAPVKPVSPVEEIINPVISNPRSEFDMFTNRYLQELSKQANKQENDFLLALGQNALQNRRDISKRREQAIKSGANQQQLALEGIANVMAANRGASQLAQQAQQDQFGLLNQFYGNTQNLLGINYTADQARAGQESGALGGIFQARAIADELGISFEQALQYLFPDQGAVPVQEDTEQPDVPGVLDPKNLDIEALLKERGIDPYAA